MGRIPSFEQDQGSAHGTNTEVACVVIHRDYAPSFGSAFHTIKNNGVAHTLIGSDERVGRHRKIEFLDMMERAWHANGANWRSVGHEVHGTNEDPLSDDDVRALAEAIIYHRDVMGIPAVYLDPFSVPRASQHVNDPAYGFRGWLSHYSVQTDDGSYQHTDLLTVEDWNRAMVLVDGGVSVPVPPPVNPTPIPAESPGPFDDGVLSLGDEGDWVGVWQYCLNVYCAQQLDVDGIFGPETEAATRRFQEFFGLTVDGIVGPETNGTMQAVIVSKHPDPSPQPNVPAYPGHTLSVDDPGPGVEDDDVRTWQAQMAVRGWGLLVDGRFGQDTDRVARAFQAEKGMQVDGIVGPYTWSAAWTTPIT